MPNLSAVMVFTDGSCLGNPGPGGWAALIRTASGEHLLSGGEAHTTNNRMELMAAIAPLEFLTAATEVVLTTDSQYVKQGLESWMAGWRRRGWRTKDNQPVKNQDLWQRLDAAAGRHQVRLEWVRGHAGHPENERVDMAARQEAQRQPARPRP